LNILFFDCVIVKLSDGLLLKLLFVNVIQWQSNNF